MPNEDPTPPADGGDVDPQPTEATGSSPGADHTQALARKLRKLEKVIADRDKADEDRKLSEMGEVDRLKKERDEARAEALAERETTKAANLRHRFEGLASKAGAVDADAAYRLADLSGVEPGDDKALQAIIDAQKVARKYLFAQVPASGIGAGANPAGGNSGEVTGEMIKRMTSAEFAKFKADRS